MNHTARYVGHLITKGRFRKRNDFQKTAGASALPRATRFDFFIVHRKIVRDENYETVGTTIAASCVKT